MNRCAHVDLFGKVNTMVRTTLVRVASGMVLATSVMAYAFGAVAGAQTASVVIAPRQMFIGLVNGQRSTGSVDVECPGPLRIGQTGYPAPGQTVGVSDQVPSLALAGNTGSRGRSIVARFVTSTAAALPTVTFTQYGTQAIPSTALLPCDGSGTVLFSPQPTSQTARSARVSVTFVSTCTNPCPVVERR